MRLIKNTTELIGIKDQNIKISLVFETDTHIEIAGKLMQAAAQYLDESGKKVLPTCSYAVGWFASCCP